MTVTSERAQALIDRLGDLGIEAENIQTVDLSLWPETDRNGTPAGYRARNGLRVEFTDLTEVGALIASALEALGDGAEMGGISFIRKDRKTLEQEARTAAWAAAEEKATELAQLAGVTLGRPLSVEELSGGGGGMPKLARMQMAADNVPVEAGSTQVTVTLAVRFALVG